MVTSAISRAARYAPLSPDELAAALRLLPEWRAAEQRLSRTVRCDDLWGLLQQVCEAEDELDHHSEVTLDAGTVTFTVWTHVRECLTAADLELAARIDEALERLDVR